MWLFMQFTYWSFLQILYNRAICQLGLCAFRRGLITEAHHGLSEIQNTQRARELLAQGVPVRPVEQRTFEQVRMFFLLTSENLYPFCPYIRTIYYDSTCYYRFDRLFSRTLYISHVIICLSLVVVKWVSWCFWWHRAPPLSSHILCSNVV